MLSAPLLSFLQVANLGNVSRAADRLHLTQPAVSKQIRALEQALGAALVERSGRGIRLTQAGELVRAYALRGAGLFDECRMALRDLEASDAGSVAIAAGVTTSIFQLPPVLAELRRRRPLIEVTLRTGTSVVVEELVCRREVDCGLVTTRPSGDDLTSTVLFREDIVCVVAPHARYGTRPELEALPLILFPSTTGFRAYLTQKIGAERLSRQVKMEMDSVEAIKSFVAVGLGASLLPLSAVKSDLATRRLKRVGVRGLGKLRRSTTLIRRRDRYLSTAARDFIELLSTLKTGGR
jgi:DNA-binding transcriptional LysR family regulator